MLFVESYIAKKRMCLLSTNKLGFEIKFRHLFIQRNFSFSKIFRHSLYQLHFLYNTLNSLCKYFLSYFVFNHLYMNKLITGDALNNLRSILDSSNKFMCL